MKKLTECHNEKCNGDGMANVPISTCSEGHRDTCPYCGSYNVTKEMFPENAEDVGILREDYNRRNMHKPGFVPSVEYVRQPDGTTKPRES